MLPIGFCERAKEILGDEYDDFISALEGEAVRGLRVNFAKTDIETVKALLGDSLTELNYVDGGFIYGGEDRIGRTPEHHAGMIYMQDPGAMAALAATDICEGMRVLDTCSAPGGKSSQARNKIGESGFLHSNEYVPKRAKTIVGNFERLGIKNALVTSLDTAALGKMYDAYFDLVIVDAPCSGEGMFRKSDEALTEWSVENVRLCAERQTEILNNVSGTVKVGGRLLYSTCTYSPEENEEVVLDFLTSHPNFRLIEVKDELKKVTRHGLASKFDGHPELALCRRFYPHVAEGEGQFVALLERIGEERESRILFSDASRPLDKKEQKIAEDTIRACLGYLPDARLRRCGENIVLISGDQPIPPSRVFMSGVLVGEISGSIMKPSHQFFSAYGSEFLRKVELKSGDARVNDYLSGLEIPADVKDGWCVVTYEGATIGGAKASGGRAKNHYPKGLRNMG